jgi:chromosome segregation ATPase
MKLSAIEAAESQQRETLEQVEQLRNQKLELEQEISMVISERNQLNDRVRELQSDVTELMKQRCDFQISMEANLNQMAGEIRQLGQQKLELEQEMLISQSERDELAEQVSEFRDKLSQLESEFAKRHADLQSTIDDQCHQALEQFEHREAELEQEIATLESTHGQLLEQVDESQLSQLESQCADLEKRHGDLQSAECQDYRVLEQLEERKAQLQQDILMLESKRDKLLEEGTESLQPDGKSAHSQLINQTIESEQEISITQSKRDELARQVTEFQDKQSQLESEFAKRRGDLQLAVEAAEDEHHRVLEQLDRRKMALEQDLLMLESKRDKLLEHATEGPPHGGRESADSNDVQRTLELAQRKLELEDEMSIGESTRNGLHEQVNGLLDKRLQLEPDSAKRLEHQKAINDSDEPGEGENGD